VSTPEFLRALRAIVGVAGLLLDDIAGYVTAARYGVGRALCVVRPGTTEEVSRVIAFCVRERVPFVPQGANTGLVGAGTPDDSGAQIVLGRLIALACRCRGRRSCDSAVRRASLSSRGILI